MGRLNLPDGARALIFRAIVDRLRTNATLAASGIERWFAWEDVDDDNSDLDDFQGPCVRLTPNLGAMAWMFAGTQSGDIIITVEASLPGMHGDDFMNLQDAIEEAFYTDDHLTFILSLQAIGASTGLVNFAPLTQDHSQVGREEKWRPMGELRIAVNRNLLAG